MSVLLLMVAGIGGLLAAFWNYGTVTKAVQKARGAKRLLPKAIGTVVITAQLSELVKAVEHVSVTHIAAALLLLAVMLASRAGTEGEEIL